MQDLQHSRQRWPLVLAVIGTIGVTLTLVGFCILASLPQWASRVQDAQHRIVTKSSGGSVFFLTPAEDFWPARLFAAGLIIIFISAVAMVVYFVSSRMKHHTS
jgi:threonine/homoserine/homoserine lactone efflux protein